MFIFSKGLLTFVNNYCQVIMKNIALLIFLFSLTLSAQENIKPKFEKEGELIKAMFYHDNGEIAQIGYFKDKKRHGNWISYHPSGKKSTMGTYDSGLKTGQWFFWSKNDLIEVIYEENKIINVLEWNNSEKKLIAKNN